ncbi:NAD(+)--rifampin ADP-ribosyltransferase [Pseudoduganella sp. RAF19]|jgi:rifampin ADP-ribosylating transferase
MKQHYHGTRVSLQPGEMVTLGGSYVYLTDKLDEAVWEAEIGAGDGAPKVYLVEPTGETGSVVALGAREPTRHPSMSLCSRQPLRVIGEVTEWKFYHGTRADLKPGDLLKPGHNANFGEPGRTANHIYFARTLDAATWGAELALGEGPGRIYIVEPTGPIEDDPNLTDKKFRGNPTKSFRSREPLRVVAELTHWQGHSPEAIQAMRDGLAKLKQTGAEIIDD